jgi:hypothetical protein
VSEGHSYLRVGTWRDSEESWNYATGDFEDGISVYALDPTTGQPIVPPDGEWADSDLADRLASDDPKFIVTGRETGTGGDGEPLLRDVRIVGTWPIPPGEG